MARLEKSGKTLTKQAVQPNCTFSHEDLVRLQQIHLKKTGQLLTMQETLEMGLRIISALRAVAKPIPAL